MSFTHRIGTTYADDGGSVASSTSSVVADGVEGFDGTIPSAPSGPALELDIGFTAAKVKALCLVSDKAVTINTNAADGTGGNSLALAAGVPLVWRYGYTWTCPITINVTSIFVVNTGSSAAAVKLRFLLDV